MLSHTFGSQQSSAWERDVALELEEAMSPNLIDIIGPCKVSRSRFRAFSVAKRALRYTR